MDFSYERLEELNLEAKEKALKRVKTDELKEFYLRFH